MLKLLIFAFAVAFTVAVAAAAEPFVYTPCPNTQQTFNVTRAELDPAEAVLGSPLDIGVYGILNKTFTAGTMTVAASYMGVPLPFEEPTVDACALSSSVSCPLIASSEERFLGMTFDVPRFAGPCPKNRAGVRTNCYTVSVLFEDQDAETVACFDVDLTVLPARSGRPRHN